MAARSKRASELSPLSAVITIGIVITTLYFGKDVLVPFALALLISFLLTAPVTWLESLKLGRPLSVLIVLSIALCIGAGALWVGAQQLSEIVSNLPHYQENIRRKIEAVRNPKGPALEKATEGIQQITTLVTGDGSPAEREKNLSPANVARKRATKTPQAPAPVPVEVVSHRTSTLQSLGLISTSLARFLGVAAAVIVLTIFMLMKRTDLRNRLFRLWGRGRLVVATTALDDAATRVSRYLLTQSLINTTFGTLLGFGLYFIGVPYAPFWGVLAALLRFIPYVGTWVAGACPVLLALAVFEGWTKPLLTLGLFVGIEAVTSGLAEPWLYATRTGISSLAILVSAAFWTLLWGPIGLVLSTPLTVCLAVVGRHVPQLEFLYILLGDEPVLTPEAHYYQRLLAMDEDEAAEVAERFLDKSSLTELYDSVLIPALSLAERDRHEDRLDEQRQKFIHRSTKEIIEELGERTLASEERPVPANRRESGLTIRCIPARDDADELVGLMLAQLLRGLGYDAEAISLGPVDSMLDQLVRAEADVLFVSALPPFAVTHARAVCRRARQMRPDLKVIVGMWDPTIQLDRVKERLGPDCSEAVMTTLAQAEAEVRVLEAANPLTRHSA
ncbi:MAG: AI-2E family transporter [Acidobacteriaceae bacterium]|nr:AI-2E family transporter [Acidobacteriaceae bacterium]MBV9779478.1 AI-2E family transporter [Acidobacteriaceae bacterium]